MSEHAVDLGAIRGDWEFHARYVTIAMESTLKRVHKSWRSLKARGSTAGSVPMTGDLMQEFLEAVRQTRALSDDILLLQDTMPTPRKKSARKAGKKKARAKK
jgi:hypothetical protein